MRLLLFGIKCFIDFVKFGEFCVLNCMKYIYMNYDDILFLQLKREREKLRSRRSVSFVIKGDIKDRFNKGIGVRIVVNYYIVFLKFL